MTATRPVRTTAKIAGSCSLWLPSFATSKFPAGSFSLATELRLIRSIAVARSLSPRKPCGIGFKRIFANSKPKSAKLHNLHQAPICEDGLSEQLRGVTPPRLMRRNTEKPHLQQSPKAPQSLRKPEMRWREYRIASPTAPEALCRPTLPQLSVGAASCVAQVSMFFLPEFLAPQVFHIMNRVVAAAG